MNYEPKTFIQGETLKWKRSFSDYPAGDGWVLVYYFRGAGSGFDAAATVDGNDYLVTVPTATTSACAVGDYEWQAWFSKDGEKHLADSGRVAVKAGLNSLETSATFDGRSEAEKTLTAIRAMLANKATLDQQSYVIGNRQLNRIPIADLLMLEKRYVMIVSRERQAARIKKGGKFFKTVHIRMSEND